MMLSTEKRESQHQIIRSLLSNVFDKSQQGL